MLRPACVLLAFALTPLPTQAAESYDNCTGFIDALPATISTQGVWCLRQHLATAITSGNAITVATNNVTLDCNDFKIGGLAAGDSSDANGIYAAHRHNITVRQCGVRGFRTGIYLIGDGSGHLVEDNRLDQNLYFGIYILGDNNRVQRNRVYDTGGYPAAPDAAGIKGDADMIDNTVAGVFAKATNTYPFGIFLHGVGTEVRGNQVRGLSVKGTGVGTGIATTGSDGSTVVGNRVAAAATTAGFGIRASQYSDTICIGNTVVRFETAFQSCGAVSGNLALP